MILCGCVQVSSAQVNGPTNEAEIGRNSHRNPNEKISRYNYENEKTFVLYQIISSLHENLISLLGCTEKNKYPSIFVIGSLWI